MYDLTVSIVIFNNSQEQLRKVLANCLADDLEIRLFVVDNSPSDCIKEICQDERIEYIFNNGNVGYGTGHNIAIKKSIECSKYHLILNPDVYFEMDTLKNLFNFMEKNLNIGLVMPKVLYRNGSIQHLCKLLPTPFDLIIRRFLPVMKKVKEKRDQTYELRFTDYDRSIDVPYLSGCFMFIRTEVFKKVGLFDERFFMYLEDTDLSRRINRFYRTVYYPDVSIYHGYEKGSYKNAKLLSYHIGSAIKYFNKWGWFFDRERREVNRRTLEKIGYSQSKERL